MLVNPEEINQQRREATRLNLATTLIDALLGIIKVIAGLITHSHGLLADGIHSFADLITDIMVTIATYFGRQDADDNHPYGHGRIETMASLGLGVVLIIVAIIIAWDSIVHLFNPVSLHIGGFAIGVIIFALICKEIVFQWTIRVAKRHRSALLTANAWHSRSDSLSSLIVLIGLFGALLGFPWLDPLAALIVTIMIAKIGVTTFWNASKELIDTTIDMDFQQKIHDCVLTLAEVKSIHKLRGRMIGSLVSIDLHLTVDSHISVSEGHEIGNAVTNQLRQQFDSIKEVTFHIDPQEDQLEENQTQLPIAPLRSEIITTINQFWHDKPFWHQRITIQIHYSSKPFINHHQVSLELFLPSACIAPNKQDIENLCQQVPWLNQLISWHAD